MSTRFKFTFPQHSVTVIYTVNLANFRVFFCSPIIKDKQETLITAHYQFYVKLLGY
jgi:hypothetical protein